MEEQSQKTSWSTCKAAREVCDTWKRKRWWRVECLDWIRRSASWFCIYTLKLVVVRFYEFISYKPCMLGQVGKYSEIINNGQWKYILCVETFSTPENIFFSPQKKIKCPNIFSPLPRFTFGSPFFLKSAPKTFCWSPEIFCVPQKILLTPEFFVTCPFFKKKKLRGFFFSMPWCHVVPNLGKWSELAPSALLRHSQRCFNCPNIRKTWNCLIMLKWTYEK